MTEPKYNEPGYVSPAVAENAREIAAWKARQPAKRRRDMRIDVSRILIFPVALLLLYTLTFTRWWPW